MDEILEDIKTFFRDLFNIDTSESEADKVDALIPDIPSPEPEIIELTEEEQRLEDEKNEIAENKDYSRYLNKPKEKKTFTPQFPPKYYGTHSKPKQSFIPKNTSFGSHSPRLKTATKNKGYSSQAEPPIDNYVEEYTLNLDTFETETTPEDIAMNAEEELTIEVDDIDDNEQQQDPSLEVGL